MTEVAINQFDAALSLFASLGVWPVWYRLQKIDARNPLEEKLQSSFFTRLRRIFIQWGLMV